MARRHWRRRAARLAKFIQINFRTWRILHSRPLYPATLSSRTPLRHVAEECARGKDACGAQRAG